jgi:hypothetical protein
MDNGDLQAQIEKQELKIQKQRAMREKLEQQQQHKHSLREQKETSVLEQEEHERVFRELEKLKEPPPLQRSIVVEDGMADTIERQIEQEIIRKEREMAESARKIKAEEDEKISNVVRTIRRENESQLYHYDRVFKQKRDTLITIQNHLSVIGNELKVISTTTNKNAKRTSILNANKTYELCTKMINDLLKLDVGRVKF